MNREDAARSLALLSLYDPEDFDDPEVVEKAVRRARREMQRCRARPHEYEELKEIRRALVGS